MKIFPGRQATCFLLLVILIIAHAQQQNIQTQVSVSPPAFILELKVSINDKFYNIRNISLSLNQTSTAKYTFNLSAVNFNKNVSVVSRLFAWYNSNWIERQSQSLKITGQQTAYYPTDHLLLKLLKLNSKNYQFKLYHNKTPCVLQNSSLLISYDPESSLLVSRIQDPSLFTSSQHCAVAPKVDRNTEPLQININLQIVNRTDIFIDYKNHLIQLNEIQAKLKKQKLILEYKPIPPSMFQPVQRWKALLSNVKSLQGQIKKIKEIIELAKSKGYRNLIMPQVRPINIEKDFRRLFQLAKSNVIWNVTLVDALLPAYRFVYHQTHFLDRIEYLKQAMRRNLHLEHFDWVKSAEKHAEVAFWALIIQTALWVLLDIFEYKNISNHIGLSQSFGYFLNVWIFLQIITLSIWVASLAQPLVGLVIFFSLIFTHRWGLGKLEMLFAQKKHYFSTLDRVITKTMFNSLIIAIMTSVGIHIWYLGDVKSVELILWTFSQLQELLSQYYYCLVFIPQIILSFKFKNASTISKKRLLIFSLIILLRGNHDLMIDTHYYKHLPLFYLKEEILWFIIVYQKIIYRKSAPIPEKKVEDQQFQSQQQHQSSNQLSRQQQSR